MEVKKSKDSFQRIYWMYVKSFLLSVSNMKLETLLVKKIKKEETLLNNYLGSIYSERMGKLSKEQVLRKKLLNK